MKKMTDATTGLTAAEVEASRRAHGSNQLTPPERDPWWKELLEKFTDPLIVILMVAAVISLIPVIFVPGHSWVESAGIVGAVLLATTVGFVNEYRANKEFDILNKVNDVAPVRVLRDGRHLSVPKNELVVGDVVTLESGEEVPADGVVLEACALYVDQSSLTGESVPVHKTAEAAEDEAPGAYAGNVVLRSTMVAEGYGVICVTHVGDATEIGKVARAAAEDDGAKSPLNQQLDALSEGINVVGSSIAFFLFVSLVAHDAIRGVFVLAPEQWGFFAVVIAAVGVALLRVWYPILQGLLGYMHVELKAPGAVEEEGLWPWVKCLLAGAVVFGVGVGGMIGCGMLSADAATWMPTAAAENILLYFMIAITLIVVAVPEGLPMSVTLSLAYSMRKMARQNNLVRRMDACETIGAATVVCSDKTGTLTLNRMSVKGCYVGQVAERGAEDALFALMAEGIALNSTADLDASGHPLGNVTEGALLSYLRGLGVDYDALRREVRALGRLPFSGTLKFMATCVESHALSGQAVLHVKGAPEVVLARCTAQHGGGVLGADERAAIEAAIAVCQRKAMRVLALAYKPARVEAESDMDAACAEMVWMGYFAIQDPVREDVPEAVASCTAAGVGVKIVTGDNRETACQIAREIGLLPADEEPPPGSVLTGDAFARMSDVELAERVNGVKVLSRAKPMDKLRLVEALQRQGHVVAVTGDGTNDAPALNHADVGLSMGITGTSVAKEASDIVLLDDSFSSITKAIKWGRSLYRNIQKFIVFQLTVNVAACGLAALGPFIGCELPLTVTQMLWVNLIMDTFAALALATEPPSESVMSQRPRNKSAFIITPSMWRWILVFGGVFVAALVAYIKYITPGGAPASIHDVTLLFTGFVMLQFWNLFNARVYGTCDCFLKGLFKNLSFVGIALTILIGQIVAVQYGGHIFRTEPLTLCEWLIVAGVTAPVLIVGEVARMVGRAAAAR